MLRQRLGVRERDPEDLAGGAVAALAEEEGGRPLEPVVVVLVLGVVARVGRERAEAGAGRGSEDGADRLDADLLLVRLEALLDVWENAAPARGGDRLGVGRLPERLEDGPVDDVVERRQDNLLLRVERARKLVVVGLEGTPARAAGILNGGLGRLAVEVVLDPGAEVVPGCERARWASVHVTSVIEEKVGEEGEDAPSASSSSAASGTYSWSQYRSYHSICCSVQPCSASRRAWKLREKGVRPSPGWRAA